MRTAAALALVLLAGGARAVGIESVQLLRDAGGSPGEPIESGAFDPSQRLQHFRFELDEFNIGKHLYTITVRRNGAPGEPAEKLAQFDTEVRFANVITAQVEWTADWPVGRYRIELAMDGEPLGGHEYSVGVEWPRQRIRTWRFYRVGKEGLEPVDEFVATDRVTEFLVATDGYLPRGALMRFVILAVDAEGEPRPIGVYDHEVPDDPRVVNTASTRFTRDDDWTPGTYWIQVNDGERVLGDSAFDVRAAGPARPADGTEAR